jgi:hypothetical protein
MQVTAPLLTGYPRDLARTTRFANEFVGHARDSRGVTAGTHGRPLSKGAVTRDLFRLSLPHGGRVSFGLRAARGGRQDLGRLLPLALESPADDEERPAVFFSETRVEYWGEFHPAWFWSALDSTLLR